MSPKAVLLIIVLNVFAASNGSPTMMKFKHVKMHPDCENSMYCFKRTEDYPEELMENLVKKANILNIDGAALEHRWINDNNVTICQQGTSYEPIYQIKDINNNVRYVVQTTRFQQIIQVEWCKNKGEIVEDAGPLMVKYVRSMSYRAYCLESYTNYRFLVLAENGRSFESVRSAGVPVSCRCEIFNEDTNVQW